MKALLHILTFSLLSGLSLTHVYAQNTYYGTGAGKGGAGNTHIGAYAGKINTGYLNTFLGNYSGYKNTTGFNNTFLGTYSGYSNTNGWENTFLGTYSGYRNTTGKGNTFIGSISGNFNTIGGYNTFLGSGSGYKNTTGSYNTFLGHFGGYHNTTVSSNTYLGFNSGALNMSGEKNVFIGYKAGRSEPGSNRLYIDNDDDNKPLLYGNFYHNVLSIGTKYTGTAYKLVVPGKVRVNALDVVSDERVKKDIHTLQDALTKVQKVEGVSYALKKNGIEEQEQSNEMSNTHTGKATEPILYGFLAQNIQEVFPELVTEEEGLLAVNYQGMIPVLVEAIKELAAQKDHVTQLQAQIIELQQALTLLTQTIRDGTSAPAPEDTPGAQLYQNHPNPFDQSTSIRYQVAAEARQVSLIITNLQGVAVQRYDNLSAGQGQVEIAAGSLGTGTYVYTLVVDGKPIAAHKMMLSR